MLGDPDVLGNQDQFRASMEHHELTPIVESYAAYTQSLDDIESAKSMLADDDEDIRAMAREELGEAETQSKELEEACVGANPKDPADEQRVFGNRAGTGGDERQFLQATYSECICAMQKAKAGASRP